MNKKIGIIIGSIIFVIILCASYNVTVVGNSNKIESNKKIEEYIENLIYYGYFPIPVENFIKVTSKFGYRDPVYNSNGTQISGGKAHLGIDLVGIKDSRVFCIANGEVTFAGWQNGYGNCVEIRHIENGTIFSSFYAHMQNNSLQVKKGQNVSVGQVVGLQGTTGNSTGDHLHLEIRLDDKSKIDPAPYLFNKKEDKD